MMRLQECLGEAKESSFKYNGNSVGGLYGDIS